MGAISGRRAKELELCPVHDMETVKLLSRDPRVIKAGGDQKRRDPDRAGLHPATNLVALIQQKLIVEVLEVASSKPRCGQSPASSQGSSSLWWLQASLGLRGRHSQLWLRLPAGFLSICLCANLPLIFLMKTQSLDLESSVNPEKISS